MIEITRLNGGIILLNPDIIEHVEFKPDTIITFINGKTMMVKENLQTLRNKFISYQQTVHLPPNEKIVDIEDNGI